LRSHLVSIVLAFFAANFTFLILTTWYEYQSSVLAQVHPVILNEFETKLITTSDAITLCYQQQENQDSATVKRIKSIAADAVAYPASYATTPLKLVDQKNL
jgi:hypothetical protein